MTTPPAVKLQELLENFDNGMLVTQTPAGQLRSRPMAVGQVDSDGTVWLMTQRHSPKMEELATHPQANLTMQSRTKFVSLSGTVSPVDDPRKIDELWNEAWKIWFPGGKTDPTLILLRVQGETGEYWDNSGANGLKYLIEAGKAYLSGTRPDVDQDPAIHGKVALSET